MLSDGFSLSHPIWGMDRCTRFGSLCHGEGFKMEFWPLVFHCFKISRWSHGRWTPTPRECASDDIYIYCIYNIGMGQDLECHVGWTAIYQIFRRHGVPGFWPKNHIQVFRNYSIQFFTNASAHILLSPRQTQTLPTPNDSGRQNTGWHGCLRILPGTAQPRRQYFQKDHL